MVVLKHCPIDITIDSGKPILTVHHDHLAVFVVENTIHRALALDACLAASLDRPNKQLGQPPVTFTARS